MSDASSEASTPPAAAAPSQLDDAMDENAPSQAAIAQTPTYQSQLQSRAAAITSLRFAHPPQSIVLEPVVSLAHATPVYALALPAFGHHLFTGGVDGFIRRYSLYDSLNGLESTRNMAMKQATPTPGVLVGYWENTEANDVDEQGVPSGLKFGPRSLSNSVAGGKAGGSPVHSLAVQRDELFGLSGTQSGDIYLFTIRHDEGQIRHVFRSSADAKAGHTIKSPVSVLALAPDESSALSGGWDGRILQWDLNTGQAVRAYEGVDQDFAMGSKSVHQVSSLSFRPESNDDAMPVSKPASPVATRSRAAAVATKEAEASANSDAAGSPADFDPLFDRSSAASSPRAVAAGLTGSPSLPPLPRFDEDHLPKLSDDVFLSTSISGQVLLWDRRAGGKNGVRRLPLQDGTPPWAMQASWSKDGQQIYVGRRDASVDVYDMRAGSTSKLRLPTSTGLVSSVQPLPGGRHLAIASFDTLRVYDLQAEAKNGTPPWRVVPNHYGATISHMLVDPLGRFVVTAVGSRGWAIDAPSTTADGCAFYDMSSLSDACLSDDAAR